MTEKFTFDVVYNAEKSTVRFEENLMLISSKDGVSKKLKMSEMLSQRISPETAEKIQLQIVMDNDDKHTFLFNNPSRNANIADRDLFSSFLSKNMKNAVSSNNYSSLSEKKKILKQTPVLMQIYKNLVVESEKTGPFMSANDFWAVFGPLSHNDQNANVVVGKSGINSDFWMSLMPEQHGYNELRFALNTNQIDTIFFTYPKLKEKYDMLMKEAKITNIEFWNNFFKFLIFKNLPLSESKSENQVNFERLFKSCLSFDDDESDEFEKLFKEKSFSAFFSAVACRREAASFSDGERFVGDLIRKLNFENKMLVSIDLINSKVSNLKSGAETDQVDAPNCNNLNFEQTHRREPEKILKTFTQDEIDLIKNYDFTTFTQNEIAFNSFEETFTKSEQTKPPNATLYKCIYHVLGLFWSYFPVKSRIDRQLEKIYACLLAYAKFVDCNEKNLPPETFAHVKQMLSVAVKKYNVTEMLLKSKK